ncbi:MAG TPA: hypothetical protein VEG34_17550 [Thermoanaerobaculia bacterium]|nr:hypothetical protein [Thermoanaerobaculia bacterium]
MRAERATRVKNPALLFHLLVLLLVLASIAAAGGKEVAAACSGLEIPPRVAALRCELAQWTAEMLGGLPLPAAPALAR